MPQLLVHLFVLTLLILQFIRIQDLCSDDQVLLKYINEIPSLMELWSRFALKVAPAASLSPESHILSWGSRGPGTVAVAVALALDGQVYDAVAKTSIASLFEFAAMEINIVKYFEVLQRLTEAYSAR